MISGSTRVTGVIGSPVRHSLSPAILNAAFRAVGADWICVAFEVPEGRAPEAIAAVRALGIGGLSVTMPHKASVHDAVDECTPVADALGAVNCVWWRGDRLVGDNTDGAGFVDALKRDEGIDVAGLRCVVVGAGGAGRAVALALGEAGAADIAIANRSPAPAARAAALAGERGRVGAPGDIGAADLVVNATPLGMGVVTRADGTPEPLPLEPHALRPGQVVVDLIYHPATTPLLAAARGRGAVAVNGLGMLIHQAAHAFRRWTGKDAPLEAMSAAAVAELTRRT
ncbi:MAG TPA: shikimate dehydrogenase [Acidimicrobiales bacterium]|nr:shikimate dehydrogenase [Acidimicrobiales bacterium]